MTKLNIIIIVAVVCVAVASCHREADTTAAMCCGESPVIREVTCRPESVTIAVNGQTQLAATVHAEPGFTDLAVTWSSNSRNAVVSSDGIVTGVSAGPAVVIAASHGDPNVKGACAVTVVAPTASGP